MSAETESLYRVVYMSRATRPMTRGELQDLMLGAQHRNAESGITGMLVYGAGTFMQALEGPGPVVQELLGKIGRDPRHDQVVVLDQQTVRTRDFRQWAMRVESLEDHKDLDLDDIRELMRTRRVTDPGIAYRFLLAFKSALVSR